MMNDNASPNDTSPICDFSSAAPQDVDALENRIERLSEQLASLTEQLTKLKAGNVSIGNADSMPPAQRIDGAAAVSDEVQDDPFATFETVSDSFDPGDPSCDQVEHSGSRTEVQELFSKMKAQLNEEEVLEDVRPTEDCQVENLQKELVEPELGDSDWPREEPDVDSAVDTITSEPESVADVLARMKASGQLDCDLELEVGGHDDSTTSGSGVSTNDTGDSGSADAGLGDRAATATAESHESAPEPDGPHDDVQTYMSQLLNRLKGGPAETPVQEVPEPTVEVAPAPCEPEPTEERVAPLDPSEFVPSKVAPERNANMEAMRQLALQSTRGAVSVHEAQRRKARCMVAGSGVLAALSASGFTSMLSSRAGDLASLIAVSLAVVAIGLTSVFLKTWLLNCKGTARTQQRD